MSMLEEYSSNTLVSSSSDRGWSGISADLRTHSEGFIAGIRRLGQTEIAVNVRGDDKPVVTMQGTGVFDQKVAELGTIWLCPTGWQADFIHASHAFSGILHINLDSSVFSPASLGDDIDASVVASIRIEKAFQDPLMAQIAYAIDSELQSQTSSGRLLVETLARGLAARLVQSYLRSSSDRVFRRMSAGLDHRRLVRVMDFIDANLEGDLSLDSLASVAALSCFHFAREFKSAIGQTPHQYVSAKRLERAKALLIQGNRPVADIAISLNFSGQSSFTRAFRQATGHAPGQYRRRFKCTRSSGD